MIPVNDDDLIRHGDHYFYPHLNLYPVQIPLRNNLPAADNEKAGMAMANTEHLFQFKRARPITGLDAIGPVDVLVDVPLEIYANRVWLMECLVAAFVARGIVEPWPVGIIETLHVDGATSWRLGRVSSLEDFAISLDRLMDELHLVRHVDEYSAHYHALTDLDPAKTELVEDCRPLADPRREFSQYSVRLFYRLIKG